YVFCYHNIVIFYEYILCILILLLSYYFFYFFFFFQAEDGIRDRTVTGVQTCALPISQRRHAGPNREGDRENFPTVRPVCKRSDRSEERRVGKECRSRWSPDH